MAIWWDLWTLTLRETVDFPLDLYKNNKLAAVDAHCSNTTMSQVTVHYTGRLEARQRSESLQKSIYGFFFLQGAVEGVSWTNGDSLLIICPLAFLATAMFFPSCVALAVAAFVWPL